MMQPPFRDTIEARLIQAGLDNGRLLRESMGHAFDNAQCIYGFDTFYLRFDRDRSRVSVLMGPLTDLDVAFLTDDIGVALGWWSVEAAVAREPLGLDVLDFIATHQADVTAFFGTTPIDAMRKRIDTIAQQRVKLAFDL